MSQPDWLDPGRGFGPETLPYCVFSRPGAPPRVGVGVGDRVLDAGALLDEPLLAAPTLNPLLAAGPDAWARIRGRIQALVAGADPRVAEHLHAEGDVRLLLPFEVADYVDFYSSLEHATNVSKVLRPQSPGLPPAWRHLPIGYHGRAGTVVVSGTPISRPSGLRLVDGRPEFGPSLRLDFEAELGFVVGVPTRLGERVDTAHFAEHVFGVAVCNDWSARDIQGFETVPLGPFLSKSFATSISPWVVPLAALEPLRRPGPEQDPPPAGYLRRADAWALDLLLSVEVNGTQVSRPAFTGMYWTADQQLAHLTVNGASLRTGDLFASGTVSDPTQFGSLIELTRGGTEPLRLADGSTRGFLQNGDSVTISLRAGGDAGVGLGSVSGVVGPEGRRIEKGPST